MPRDGAQPPTNRDTFNLTIDSVRCQRWFRYMANRLANRDRGVGKRDA